uniref:site-specific DNA-methyltransferase (adenine-specific) n=1 Tax=Geobacter metallireducens TaxID=28232 RepID=A0A831U2L0_GEOME
MATGIPKAPILGNIRAIGSLVRLEYPEKQPEHEVLAGPRAELVDIGSLTHGDSENGQFFYGDNLPILRTLLDDYREKVQLIYIDPPFASSGNYATRSLDHAYEDDLHGHHYIEFIRKRLVVLRELLSPTGSIYVHLDANMAFHIKVVMDEVFGPQNFRNFITRKKCNPKNFTKNSFGNISDYILFYSKSSECHFNRQYEPWTEETSKKEYQYIDEGGRRFKKVPLHAPGTRNGATGQPWRGKNPPPGKHWQYPPDVLEEMDRRGEIYWSPNGNPRRKIYLDNSQGIPIQDIWLDVKDPHNQNIRITGYPTEKNQGVLERIILASSQPGDLVLDAFAGSGTTMAAAFAHGRRCLGIDRSPESLRTVLGRFMYGLSRMGDFVGSKPSEESKQLGFSFGSVHLAAEKSQASEALDIFQAAVGRKVA